VHDVRVNFSVILSADHVALRGVSSGFAKCKTRLELETGRNCVCSGASRIRFGSIVLPALAISDFVSTPIVGCDCCFPASHFKKPFGRSRNPWSRSCFPTFCPGASVVVWIVKTERCSPSEVELSCLDRGRVHDSCYGDRVCWRHLREPFSWFRGL
jgi:hypothetical protein